MTSPALACVHELAGRLEGVRGFSRFRRHGLAVFAIAVAGCNRAPPPPPGATSSAPAAPASSAATTEAPAPSAGPATSAAAASDGAIDALVARLRPSRGLWSNGHFPKLDSPEGATTSEVLTEMFAREKGTVSTFQILEERDVTIGGRYRAARLRTDHGKMIVLLRWDTNKWWTRAFPD